MDNPIYKLSFYSRTSLARAMTVDEQTSILAKRERIGESIGRKTLLTAAMGWSNERFEYFSVELFPSLNALRSDNACQESLGWRNLVSGETYLGIPMDDRIIDLEPLPPAGEGKQPVYRVYMSRPTPLAYSLTTEEMEEVLQHAREAGQVTGLKPVLGAYMRWNNEEWEYFGVELFPNAEDALRYTQYLSVSGWYRFTESRSFLGDPMDGVLTFSA